MHAFFAHFALPRDFVTDCICLVNNCMLVDVRSVRDYCPTFEGNGRACFLLCMLRYIGILSPLVLPS